jgi:hypothetical protein
MIDLILGIALLGFVVWAITTLVPMPAAFQQAIIVVALLAVVLYVLGALGLRRPLDLPLPRLR